MEKIKINIDTPDLKDADILKHKNFGNVMNAVGKLQVPLYKTGKFWGLTGGGISVATVTTILVMNATSIEAPIQTEVSAPALIEQLAEVTPNTIMAAPFKSSDVPDEKYSIDPTINNEIITEDGSILLIPVNSILNADGSVAKEMLTINYRDFYTSYDIFLAGIPMDIENDGKDGFLESAGMFEITTEGDYQIDPKKPIQVLFKSTSNDETYDQYSLNEEGWKNDNPCITTVINEQPEAVATAIEKNELLEPVLKQEGDHTRIFSKDDLSKFDELKGYANIMMKFSNQDEQLSDQDVIFDSYQIERGAEKNTYKVILERNGKSFEATTTIVYDAEAYTKAVAVYQAESDRIAEKEERNKQNVIQGSSDLSYSSLSDPGRLIISASNGNFQTFSISAFGAYNCDRILLQTPKKHSIEFAADEDRAKVIEVYSFFPGFTSVERKGQDDEIYILNNDQTIVAFICKDEKMVVGRYKDFKINKNTIAFPKGQQLNRLEGLAKLSSMI